MIPDSQMPSPQDLLWPTLKALDSSGGSASIQELSPRVAMYMKLPDEILNIPHKEGPQTEVDYQAAWARSILKNVGAIDNTARGVWTITDKGREVQSDEQARAMARTARPSNKKSKQRRGPVAPDPDRPRQTPTDPDRPRQTPTHQTRMTTGTGRMGFSTFFEAWSPMPLSVCVSAFFGNLGSPEWR